MLNLQKFLIDNDCLSKTEEEIQALFEEKALFVNFEDDLALFTYAIDADFTDKVVRECRGIILYRDDWSVACYPFNKFGNYTESYADDIDWTTARVQEKLDGSIIKVWYHKRKNEWVISTNNKIYAKDAILGNEFQNFANLVESVWTINYEDLNKDKTYIFELVSPYNRVIIPYDMIKLYHIGTRDNITFEECNDDIGIEKPKEYDVHTLNEVKLLVEEICTPEDRHEGVVVVDGNWHRIKVKNTFYIESHYVMVKPVGSIKKIMKMMDENDVNELVSYVPKLKHVVKYYEWQFEEVKYEIEKFLNYCASLRNVVDTRKDYAAKIQKHKYAQFGFKFYGIPNTMESVRDIINNLTYINVIKYIEPYKERG